MLKVVETTLTLHLLSVVAMAPNATFWLSFLLVHCLALNIFLHGLRIPPLLNTSTPVLNFPMGLVGEEQPISEVLQNSKLDSHLFFLFFCFLV